MRLKCLHIETLARVREELERIGVHPQGCEIMAPKALVRLVKVCDVKPLVANILKQEMLSIGGDAGVAYGCIDCSVASSDVLLIGTVSHYHQLKTKLERQSPQLQEVGEAALRLALEEPSANWVWQCRDISLPVASRTLIMGIINVTPDSFSDGGSYLDQGGAIELGRRFAAEGADIVDIGGESTRPGAQPVPPDEEMRRVLPVIEQLKAETQIPISLDTRKSKVAQAGLDLGVDIINDVTGLRGDSQMKEVVAGARAGVVIMHMQGTPQTMQENPTYDDLLGELEEFFSVQMHTASQAGITPEQLVIDPGIGFGKTVAHNLEILGNLKRLRSSAGRPILVGVSRKSFIGKILNLPVEERFEGTAAAVAASVLNGANIVRVHDVKAMRRVVDVVDALANAAKGASMENA
jgi:dihydropteroate synthase